MTGSGIPSHCDKMRGTLREQVGIFWFCDLRVESSNSEIWIIMGMELCFSLDSDFVRYFLIELFLAQQTETIALVSVVIYNNRKWHMKVMKSRGCTEVKAWPRQMREDAPSYDRFKIELDQSGNTHSSCKDRNSFAERGSHHNTHTFPCIAKHICSLDLLRTIPQ